MSPLWLYGGVLKINFCNCSIIFYYKLYYTVATGNDNHIIIVIIMYQLLIRNDFVLTL